MEWAMRKKKVAEAFARSVMHLYEAVKTKGKDGARLFETFEVNVGVHQGSVLSPLLFSIVIDVVTNKKENVTSNDICGRLRFDDRDYGEAEDK